ncbi:MAG TPA: phosphatidate cytidylyltransferase [Ktedonobacterales bacterium]
MPVASSARSRTGWLTSLRQRILSAVVLIPLVIAVIWLGGWFAFAAAALVLIGGMFELRAMFINVGWRPLIILATVIGLVFLISSTPPALQWRDLLIQITFTALMVIAFVWLLIVRPANAGAVIDWALTVAIPFYLAWPLALLVLMRGGGIGLQSRGFWWLLVLLLTIWANDAADYLTGHYFGKTKLAPKVSPAKTWEGFAGGLVMSVISVFVVTFVADLVLAPASQLHLPWYHALALGVLICVFGTIGDLAESLLKRGAKVKDSGAIFPGHGGVLDRADSLLFAAIVVYFYAAALHLLV